MGVESVEELRAIRSAVDSELDNPYNSLISACKRFDEVRERDGRESALLALSTWALDADMERALRTVALLVNPVKS